MNTLFKKILKFVVATIICVLLSLAFTATKVQADSNGSLWKLTVGKLVPVVASWNLQIPALGGSGNVCLHSDNTGVISGTGSDCGGGSSFSGTDGDVGFLDPGGTALTFLDRYFEYNRPFAYLDLKTENTADMVGALSMTANTGNYIFKNALKSGITTNYLLSETALSTGQIAPIGSWGSDNQYFWVKYTTGDADWGKVLYQTPDGYIRNPQFAIDGTSNLSIDSRDGGFFIGDLTGAGDNLLLQVGLGQIVMGNYSGTSIYIDDVGGVFTLALGGANAITQNSNGLSLQMVGMGLSVKEGTNATMGTCTLVVGVCTVSTTKVTASSRIFLSVQSLGTVTLPKAVGVTARTAGTSFVIKSSDITDTSVVAWEIVEPL